jgi:hypothetical protein
MSDKIPEELRAALDRAIELCPKYVPVEHRAPIVGGGSVLTFSVAILVAARALVEAMIEYEQKAGK